MPNFSVLDPDTALNPPVKHKSRSDKEKKDAKKTKLANEANNLKAANQKKKNELADLRAMAFGSGGSGGGKKGKSKGSNKENENQKKDKNKDKKKDIKNVDTEWQKRDEEFVKDENEKCLRAAILQSKLDFERKKTATVNDPKEEDEKDSKNSKGNKSAKKKKDKPVTISLDEFNNLKANQIKNLRDGVSSPSPELKQPPVFNEEKFFNEVEEATRQTLEKEHRQEAYIANAKKAKNVNNSEQTKKLISIIETRDFEIQALRLEVEALRDELKSVKTRNKKLCEVMSLSEMRSKGELVIEIEKLTKSRDEISTEMTTLSGDLEQERTKVSTLTQELKRLGGRKRAADSTSK